jgi:hypothetical protein
MPNGTGGDGYCSRLYGLAATQSGRAPAQDLPAARMDGTWRVMADRGAASRRSRTLRLQGVATPGEPSKMRRGAAKICSSSRPRPTSRSGAIADRISDPPFLIHIARSMRSAGEQQRDFETRVTRGLPPGPNKAARKPRSGPLEWRTAPDAPEAKPL